MKGEKKPPSRVRQRQPAEPATQPRRRPAEPGARGTIEPAEMREALDSLAAGVVKVSKEGRITYANAYARGLFDMPDREPVGLSLREYESHTIWEDGTPCRYEDYPAIKCLQTGSVESGVTIGLRLPGGGIRWITASAVPLLDPETRRPEAAIVTVVDSSHPKHVENSLRESEDRNRRLVQHAPDAIVVHRAGTVVFVNAASVKLYGGRSPDDFIGRRVLQFVHPDDRDKARRGLPPPHDDEAAPRLAQRHLRLDGSVIHVEVTATQCIYRGQPAVQAVCRDVTRRRRAERAVRRAKAELERRVQERTEELSRKNAELQREQRIMEQTLALQEHDRKLVAYEIHDTILQDVIGALMFLDSLPEESGGADNENAQRLDRARGLLRKCIGEGRRMISGLRPLIIDEQGIVGGIEYLVNEFNARGLDIRLTHAMQTDRLPADLESTIFRIVQEALANVERHSQSTRADVKLTQRDETIHVEVRDEGIGFDPGSVPSRHYGLEGLRERARLAGGSASIQSAPGKGTRITVKLPLAAKQIPPDR